jgi:hypothetical protein
MRGMPVAGRIAVKTTLLVRTMPPPAAILIDLLIFDFTNEDDAQIPFIFFNRNLPVAVIRPYIWAG